MNYSAPGWYALGMGLLLLLLLQVPLVRPENWELTCPSSCECKYYDNKKVVDCHDAGFSTVPSSLSSSINVLDLTHNKIKSLEKYAFLRVNLLNLHKLILASNRIREVHKDAFKNLSLVMDLDLSNNQIDKLHLETFTGMEKMRKLILDGNILSRLEAFQFPVLNRLQHLLINNCRLSYINTYAFANLEKIKSVSLRGNRLKVLEPDLFSSRAELKSVQLGDNLWVCDCKLKRLIHWIQKEKIGEAEVACHSPERMAGIKWLKLLESELACAPQIIIPQSEVPISLGGNATLSCGARGEPLPRMKWILDGRLLTNHTELKIPFSESVPTVKFFLHEDLKDGLLWTNLTVVQLGEDFMLHGYDQSSPFKCLVENPAKMVERNVTLVIGEVVESPIITGSNLDIYILIAIICVGFLVLILIILVCVCCCRRRRPKERPVVKANGNDKAFMERNNILIVNPVEKPPRKNELYEKLPQADLELTDLTKGGHKNFEEMNYPEERVGRVRSPLTPLEEEEFEHVSQKLLNESLNTTATIDYSLQYPDLLDNVKFPRAVSPTQLSYHSLVNPLYSTNPEWRYSYVYPSEFTPNRFSQTMQPQLFQRPGYVTLPRRPRTSSVTSAPPSVLRNPLSPTLKLEPIYDTLGPRTTADGTSRTDLTRPMSRSMIDPYNPLTPLATGSPPSLPLHYVPLSRDDGLPGLSSQSSTLPRSTPNLLEDKGLAIHFPSEDAGGRLASTPKSTIHNNLNSASPKEMTSKIVPKGSSSSSSSTPLRIKPALKNVANAKNNNSNSNNNNNNTNSNLNNNDDNNLDSASRPQLPNGSLPNVELKEEGAASKKVPPKPPPKPSVKRLSVSSTASDVASKVSQAGSIGGLSYQDEGPDGTEV